MQNRLHIVFLLLFLLWPACSAAELVDRVVAEVNDEIKALLENRTELGIVKGNIATVTLTDGVVTTIVVVKSTPAQEDAKESNYSAKSSSMDGQSAVKSVAEIIKALIERNVITSVEDADKALTQLAKTAKGIIVN